MNNSWEKQDEDVVLTNGLVKKVRERQQPQGMSSGRCVKDNVLEMAVLWVLQELHHFADCHCLIYSWGQCVQQLTCMTHTHCVCLCDAHGNDEPICQNKLSCNGL